MSAIVKTAMVELSFELDRNASISQSVYQVLLMLRPVTT